uniref:MADF domain-containing protein n=1 Tax=Timema tahoe TaxID=61484 RepID=A0A7R9IJ15_9NEOP|nr:unnamed protein product [Timema tahoe]
MEAKYFAELDERLIELVKSHPILYQLSDRNYKDNFMKENVWIEIAGRLGKAVPECKTRWRTIRDSYRKIKNKKKQKGSRAGAPAKSKYNDKKLRFLDEAILKRTTRTKKVVSDVGSLRSVNNAEEDSNDKTSLGVSNEDGEADDSLALEDKTLKRKSCGPAASKKRNQIDILIEEARQERSSKLLDEIIEQKNFPPDHPIQTFFKSMASTVMTFPPHLIAETRMNVCNIVSEMEIRALRENSYKTCLKRDDDANKSTQQNKCCVTLSSELSDNSGGKCQDDNSELPGTATQLNITSIQPTSVAAWSNALLSQFSTFWGFFVCAPRLNTCSGICVERETLGRNSNPDLPVTSDPVYGAESP